MPVSKDTARRVLCTCMIAGGGLFSLVNAALYFLFDGLAAIGGMGAYHDAGELERDTFRRTVMAGLVIFGLVIAIAGILLWPRRTGKRAG